MIKKILYTFVVAAGFASCSEDYTDWANPQHNEAEDAVAAAYGVQFGGSGIDVNMADANNPDTIKLVSMTTSNPLVDSLRYTSITVNGRVIPFAVKGNDAYVSTYALDSCAMEALQTRKYEKRELNVDVEATAFPKSGTAVAIKGALKQNETPIPTPTIDPKGYYLLGNLSDNNWTPSKGIMMADKGNGIYTATVTTYGESNWFKFYGATGFSETDDWDLVNQYQYGCRVNGDEATFNMLEWNDVNTPVIAGAGTWIITLDMVNCTYKITKPELFLAGDCNGWNQIDYLASENGNNFTGYMYLNQGGFKFCSEPNWNGTNYGADFSTAADAGNIVMTEEPGYYKIDVDLEAKTYTLTSITTIGVIGSATAGGWDSDQDMTYNQTERCWEIKDLALNEGKMKFRANGAWDINWGGSVDALVQGGGDLSVEAGTYDIKLYAWANGYAKCEITKK